MALCSVKFCFNNVENDGDICGSCQSDPRLTTKCSTYDCHRRAVITNDPAYPPFCPKCKKRARK